MLLKLDHPPELLQVVLVVMTPPPTAQRRGEELLLDVEPNGPAAEPRGIGKLADAEWIKLPVGLHVSRIRQ